VSDGKGLFAETAQLVGAVGRAMGMTFKNLLRKPVTVRYPDVPRTYPDRFRGVLALTYDPATGEENCIGCRLCEYVCPPQVIKVEMLKAEKRNFAKTFTLELYACEFCELCVQVCPTDHHHDEVVRSSHGRPARAAPRQGPVARHRASVRALVGDRQPSARHAGAAEGGQKQGGRGEG
jgi:ferredoxin